MSLIREKINEITAKDWTKAVSEQLWYRQKTKLVLLNRSELFEKAEYKKKKKKKSSIAYILMQNNLLDRISIH